MYYLYYKGRNILWHFMVQENPDVVLLVKTSLPSYITPDSFTGDIEFIKTEYHVAYKIKNHIKIMRLFT